MRLKARFAHAEFLDNGAKDVKKCVPLPANLKQMGYLFFINAALIAISHLLDLLHKGAGVSALWMEFCVYVGMNSYRKLRLADR